jgi:hypothetical protein
MTAKFPNTDSVTVARIAVAWNIVERASLDIGDDTETRRKRLTEAFIETYNAIRENERSKGGVEASTSKWA